MSAGRRTFLIGEFSRRCRLPVATLRYYDRIGLLVPAVVDDFTGYRRYRPEQVPRAVLVATLRDLDISPHAIARVLAGGPSGTATLRTEQARLADEIHKRRRAIEHLDALVERRSDPITVIVEELPRRTVATLTFSSTFGEVGTSVIRAIARLRARIRRVGLEPVAASDAEDDMFGPSELAVGWGALLPLDVGDTVTGAVFTQVPGPQDGLDTVTLPTGQAIVATYTGGVETLSLAYHAAFEELDRRSGAIARGPVIETYPGLGLAGSERAVKVHVAFDEPFGPVV